jgi:predicted MFS family arabinose efflux permease
MVFLGACVFSALFNFQAGFAAARGLDYTVFYVTYTVVVIGLRFAASGFVGRQPRDRATIGLLVMMTAAVGLLLVTGANPLYALAAALLGAGYGLVYPLIQAQAVADSPRHRPTLVLTIFSVSYFLGIFGFPLVAGHLIVRWGYGALLAVLLALAAAETGLALVRAARSRRAPLLSDRGVS